MSCQSEITSFLAGLWTSSGGGLSLATDTARENSKVMTGFCFVNRRDPSTSCGMIGGPGGR